MTGESRLTGWPREFAELRGRRIEAWVGVEWALREDVAGSGPQFHDPEVPCLQLWGLQAVFDDGGLFSICTSDHEAHSGLGRNRHPEFEAKLQNSRTWDEHGGVTRWRALGELPAGLVEQVTCYADEGVLAEVLLVVGRCCSWRASSTRRGRTSWSSIGLTNRCWPSPIPRRPDGSPGPRPGRACESSERTRRTGRGTSS